MNDLNRYGWVTYRRKFLDLLQEKYKYLYKGIVLDIGGRDQGIFKKPKGKVEKWIFADIVPELNPDIILDVCDMNQIDSSSIDVINAIELFEHVNDIKRGLNECFRVLKEDGILILSSPFLFPIHSDPYDFQRWTNTKWQLELKKNGFRIEKFIIMGKYYTLLAEMIKNRIKSLKRGKRLLIKILNPLLNHLVKLDINKVKENHLMNNYHNGYFIIARK